MKFNLENNMEKINCSICKIEIEVEEHGYCEGHNAKPVTDGRCCSVCNIEVVIPTRHRIERKSKKDGKLLD